MTQRRTVVVKVGSSTLTDPRGKFRLAPMAACVAEIAALQQEGARMVLVSSGAVSSGMGALGLARRPEEVIEQQAASAVGQGRLYHTYSELFGHAGVTTAQVLLTAFDVSARTQYVNARNTLAKLLEWHVVPIVNENDSVSTDELRFGDNDVLAAQVALLLKADLLVLLTETDGLFTADPRTDPTARRVPVVEDAAQLSAVALEGRSRLGRGGMESKVRSARMATSGGVEAIIARGTRPGVIAAAVAGEDVGTRFPARDLGLSAFKLWLLHGAAPRGRIAVDAGAARALGRGSSLLPVGVTAVEGRFGAGDAVAVLADDGREVARGLASRSSEELEQLKGRRGEEVAELLPDGPPEAIHRSYLVLTDDPKEAPDALQ